MSDELIDLGIDDLTGAVQVGAGGFGVVYRAHQESLRRDVAVKMVTSTIKDRKVRIRFEREIQAMGMLSGHPNIVTVYDSGFTSDGQPYILMDYMEQGSLGDRLDRDGMVPHTDVLDIMVKVCGALETAHQAGVLHRDLKPENVLVSAYGEPKLGDFGIARLKGGPETGTSSLTASIEHVAPELLEAKPPDAGTDLYALGSTMFKLLTGTSAFVRPQDESIVPALTRIRDEPVPDLRLRGIPPEVAEVVERAMAKSPLERYASAAEMGRALRESQQRLGLLPTALPIREEDAAAARESTRTLNSADIAQSMEDLGLQGPRTSGPTPGHGTGPVGGPPPLAPPYSSQPVQGRTGPQGPPPVAPQAYSGNYAPAPDAPSTPWGKIVGVAAAVVVVGAIGAAVALSSGGGEVTPTPIPSSSQSAGPVDPTVDPTGDPTEDPTEDPTVDPALAEYAAFERLVDDSSSITVDAPREWGDVDRGPWMVDGEQVGSQILVASDIEAFQNSWSVPGLIFGASSQLRSSFDPAGLLDAVSFAEQCDYDGREPYNDSAYMGFRDEYSSCGNTGAQYTIIAAEPATEDRILLVQFQRVAPRDDAALQVVLDTFFVLPEDPPEDALPSPSPAPSATPGQ